jgi:hypothetical protein
MTSPVECMSCAATLPSIVPVVTFISGAVVAFASAVYAEPLRQWLFRPRLCVSFSGGDDCVAKTPTDANSSAVYVRLKVVNEKPKLAKGCRAYLIGVETSPSPGVFEPTLYVDSIQLAWSCQMPDDARRPLDLAHGVSQYIDLIATSKLKENFVPQIQPLPYRYSELFTLEPRTYRFTVQVSGDGVDPVQIKIVFVWKGLWHPVDVYQDATRS